MGKGKDCFRCRNNCNARIEVPGWSYDCKFGIDNKNYNEEDDCLKCEKFDPQWGFQIGGYYTHIHFESNNNGFNDKNPCMEMVIHSDGNFPKDEDEKNEWIYLHLCNFEQLEKFVEKWGKYLRSKNIIK